MDRDQEEHRIQRQNPIQICYLIHHRKINNNHSNHTLINYYFDIFIITGKPFIYYIAKKCEFNVWQKKEERI